MHIRGGSANFEVPGLGSGCGQHGQEVGVINAFRGCIYK